MGATGFIGSAVALAATSKSAGASIRREAIEVAASKGERRYRSQWRLAGD
jgi:hypothetical protein